MPQLPDTAGSARARMRLFAVLLMIPLTGYWAVVALWLLFLPEGSPGATAAVVVGTLALIFAAVYAWSTWGVAKRKRGLHITALVAFGLGILQPASGIGSWVNWLLAAGCAAATVLLALTIPRRADLS